MKYYSQYIKILKTHISTQNKYTGHTKTQSLPYMWYRGFLLFTSNTGKYTPGSLTLLLNHIWSCEIQNQYKNKSMFSTLILVTILK